MTTPATHRRLTHVLRHPYRGHYRAGGVCGVQLYQDIDGITPPVLVVTELPENRNTSVTNLIEILAAELLATYIPGALEAEEPPIVIEHYPARGHLEETWDRVTFDSWRPRIEQRYGADHIRLGAPQWQRLTAEELEQLIGEWMRP